MNTTLKAIFVAIFAACITTLGLAEPTKAQINAFVRSDTNSDEALDLKEYVDFRVSGAKKASERNNTEFDEKEVTERVSKRFKRIDTDGDGKLTAEEFYASYNNNKKK